MADAAEIVVVDARQPLSIGRMLAIPSVGPSRARSVSHRLFCACDSAELITPDARSGKVLGRNPLSGSLDVVFFDRVHKRLYVAVGDLGTIDIFDTKSLGKLGTVAAERERTPSRWPLPPTKSMHFYRRVTGPQSIRRVTR